eukprot:1107143-Prymnesium_polylepis.1
MVTLSSNGSSNLGGGDAIGAEQALRRRADLDHQAVPRRGANVRRLGLQHVIDEDAARKRRHRDTRRAAGRLPLRADVRRCVEAQRAPAVNDERAAHVGGGRVHVDAQVGRLPVARLATPRTLRAEHLGDGFGALWLRRPPGRSSVR